jgi:hypothetical protein
MNSMTSWTGKNGKNWFDPENWTHGVPSKNVHAYIPVNPAGKHFPLITDKLCIDFTLKNDGKIENEGLMVIKENGIFQNDGFIENLETGTFVNSGNIINTGEIINSGTFENNKIFTNGGILHNEGLIENENTIVNLGNWLNTGMIENFSLIANSGTFENFNILENKNDGKIEDKGFIPEELINDFSSEKYAPFSLEDFKKQNISS